jgi:hypothetical protein
MRILVACESSGRVTYQLRLRGHDAWSCDLAATCHPGTHIRDDVLRHLHDGWDMMIAFPPCTYLTRCNQTGRRLHPERVEDARLFVSLLWRAPIERIAIENPHGNLVTLLGRPTQVIQPWWFGEPYTKATCLWLKGLPTLAADDLRAYTHGARWTPPGCRSFVAVKNTAGQRSVTFAGVARAMASQWATGPIDTLPPGR